MARGWWHPTHQHMGSHHDWLEPVTKGSRTSVMGGSCEDREKVMSISVAKQTLRRFTLFCNWRSTVWKWRLSAMFWTFCPHHCEFRSLMTYTVRAQCAVQSEWCRIGSYHHHHHSPCWVWTLPDDRRHWSFTWRSSSQSMMFDVDSTRCKLSLVLHLFGVDTAGCYLSLVLHLAVIITVHDVYVDTTGC